jgi:hypothetical protein
VVPQRARTFLSPARDSSTLTGDTVFLGDLDLGAVGEAQRLPLGPSTFTVRSAMETLTPLGTADGFLADS